MKLIYVFDHPFTHDDWPLPDELQLEMLRIVEGWLEGQSFPDGAQLIIAKLNSPDKPIPNHPDLDPNLWCMPGVVLLDPGEDVEQYRGAIIKGGVPE